MTAQPKSPPHKSTTVRSIVTSLSTLGRISPDAAAWAANALFFRAPPRRRGPLPERAVVAAGRRFELASPSGRIVGWRWGRGRPVLLVHGWGGRAGQLHAFVEPLVREGFAVVAPDLPGHGASEGSSSSIPQMADALLEVVRLVGQPAGIVAHSLGTSATLLALALELRSPRTTLVAPVAHPARWYDGWMGSIVDGATAARARRDVERRLGVAMAELEGAALARRARGSLLVVHDRLDREVPVDEGRAVAEAGAGARLIETAGLGHRRILRDPRVVRHAVDFLAGRPSALDPCPHLEGDLPCEACVLARELERPALRAGRSSPAWR